MRAKYFLFGFIALCLSSSFCFVRAEEFSFRFQEDTSHYFVFFYFNEELAEEYIDINDINDLFGVDIQIGHQRAVMITDVDSADDLTSLKDGKNCDGWEIDTLGWNWTNDISTFNDRKNAMELKDIPIFEDPEDFGKISFITIMILWFIGVPTPVAEYFEELSFISEDYEVQGTSIIFEWNATTGKIVRDKYSWSPSSGAPLDYMLLTDDNQIIYQISTPESINTFTQVGAALTLIVISAIIGLVMAGYFHEQRKEREESEKVSVLDKKEFEAAETI
jgi:hypothetical protein